MPNLSKESKLRIVQKRGIKLSGVWFWHPNLEAMLGSEVTVWYDPDDLSEVRIQYGGNDWTGYPLDV